MEAPHDRAAVETDLREEEVTEEEEATEGEEEVVVDSQEEDEEEGPRGRDSDSRVALERQLSPMRHSLECS